MQAYRQAAKLVPDIEFRAYRLQQQRYQRQQQAAVRSSCAQAWACRLA